MSALPRTSVIFGGSSGIGKAIAMLCARDGDSVVVVSRNRSKLSQAARDISRAGAESVTTFRTDLNDRNKVRATLREIGRACPPPMRLVLNGGGPPFGLFSEISIDQWQASFQSVLLSQIQILHWAVPNLRPGSSVVAILSDAVRSAGPDKVLPCSLRLALLGVLKCLALQYSAQGIRFNAVSPGPTETERAMALIGKAAGRKKRSFNVEMREFRKGLPMKRMAKPEEIAAVAHFLLLDSAGYVSGMNYVCDGCLTTAPL